MRGRTGTWAIAGLLVWTGTTCAEEPVPFARQIAPILEKHCLRCHNPSVKKGGLSLATAAAAREGGDNGPVQVVGKAQESALLDAVRGTKARMPRNAPPLKG